MAIDKQYKNRKKIHIVTTPVFRNAPFGNEKHFLSLYPSFGTRHIDESVFAFILGRNLDNFYNARIGNHSSLVWLFDASCISVHTGVGYCLFALGRPEPLPDKRKCPTLSFIHGRSWGGAENESEIRKNDEKVFFSFGADLYWHAYRVQQN